METAIAETQQQFVIELGRSTRLATISKISTISATSEDIPHF